MPDRINVVDEHFKDLLATWMGQTAITTNKYLAPEKEFGDLMDRKYSASKIYSRDKSSDSLDVENHLIMKLKP